MKFFCIIFLIIEFVIGNERESEERNYCRNINRISYEKCEKITKCNFCNVKGNCGWCKERKKCIPVIYDSKLNENKAVCNGECSTLLNIDKCYETAFSDDDIKNYTKYLNDSFVYDKPQYEESEFSSLISSLEAQKINLWLKGYTMHNNNRTKENNNKEKYLRKFYKDIKYNKTQLKNYTIASLLKQNKVINTDLKSEIAIKRIISNANIKQ